MHGDPQAQRGQEFDAWYRAEYRRVRAAVGVSTGRWDLVDDSVASAFEKAFISWRRVGSMQHRTA